MIPAHRRPRQRPARHAAPDIAIGSAGRGRPASRTAPAARAMLRLLVGVAAVSGLAAVAGCGEDEQPAASRRTPAPQETAVAVPVPATKLVTVTRSEPISLPGQRIPARTDTVTLWLGPGIARRDNAEGTFLVDATRDLLAWIDHEERTWTVQTAAQVQRQLSDLAADSTGGEPRASSRDQLERLRSLLRVAVRVVDTGEEGRIDGYPCRRWVVDQRLGRQEVVTEVWLTDAIDADYSLLHRVTRPALASLPGGEAALGELDRLRGVPVRSTSLITLLGRQGRSESELVAVENVVVTPAHFGPPAGYRQTGAAAPAPGAAPAE